MSELDVQQFFSLSKDDIFAICERFRDDRRVAAAIQLVFLRASGRPMDRFSTVPKVLLRCVRSVGVAQREHRHPPLRPQAAISSGLRHRPSATPRPRPRRPWRRFALSRTWACITGRWIPLA
ncbi:DUF4158 domain-containing protein [Variovorax gracilis]|uniref:DUF4158 domain-containing protein n=1 Tax=Variovorax gracilis TaxID=3053502 RepID=UPI00336BBE8C